MSLGERERRLDSIRAHVTPRASLEPFPQLRPQGLLLVQNGGRRNTWPRLPKWLQKFVRILSRKHDEISSFCLNNGFRLQKTNRAARRWKQRPKKPFYHVSRDKILHDSWTDFSSLGQGFLRPPFWTRRRPWGRGCLSPRLINRDFKIRWLRTTDYGWTRVFLWLKHWAEYTTSGAKMRS